MSAEEFLDKGILIFSILKFLTGVWFYPNKFPKSMAPGRKFEFSLRMRQSREDDGASLLFESISLELVASLKSIL